MDMRADFIATDPGVDLARWAATGDRAALDRVLAFAVDLAHAQSSRLLGRASDADDATQEALVQLVRSAKRYDPTRPFRPWLAHLVHAACCRLLRSDRRRRRHEAQSPPLQQFHAESTMDPEIIREAVLALPEPLRATVEMHYFAGLSQAEAARALGLSEDACAKRLSRARVRLRELLRQNGIAASAVAALGTLTAAPAQAAPSDLAAAIASKATAVVLPATTIPLTAMQTGTWFITTHPVLSFFLACILGTAAATPLALAAAQEPTPAPGSEAAYVPSAEAKALLPYLDPAWSFRCAVDLVKLRPQLLQAKPVTLFADPSMAPLLAEVRQGELGDTERRNGLPILDLLVQEGNAMIIALRDDTPEPGSESRLMVGVDAGAGAEAFERWIIPGLTPEADRPQPMDPFVGLAGNEHSFLGRDGSRFVGAPRKWLQTRLASQTVPPPPPAAAWFRRDAGPLLARYAALAGPTGDPARIANILGPDWKKLRPVIDGTLTVEGLELVGAVQWSGFKPFSPLMPLSLLLRKNIPGLTEALLRQPRLAIPASPDTVFSLVCGLALPEPKQPFTSARTDMISLTELLPALSGDLAVEIRPGVPLPKGAMVLGLRPGTVAREAARQAGYVLGVDPSALEQQDPLPASFSGSIPAGQVTFTAYADRLVITLNAEISEWPGIATATAPVKSPSFAASADLPVLVRTWGTFALMLVPPAQRRLIPPVPVLAQHLPVWSLDWTTTPDGCSITERGLPLVFVFIAAASASHILEVQPELESGAPPPPADF